MSTPITAQMVNDLRDPDRRRSPRLQEGPRRGQRQHRGGDHDPAQEGRRVGRQEGRPHDQGGPDRELHPRRRQGRRPDRGQLRDRLRRPQRGLQGLREGPLPADRRHEPALCLARAGARGRPREGARDRRRAGAGQAARGRPEDRRRQAREVFTRPSASSTSRSSRCRRRR
jgi:hypothetical protein